MRACKEVLLLFNSLSIFDPGDINVIVEGYKKSGICISMIHTCGALYVAEKMCNVTNGK